MRRPLAIAAGFLLVVAAAAAGVVYADTATVTILLPTHVVTADVTLGSPPLVTSRRHVDMTETIESTASLVTISTYATGEVVFWSNYPCPPCGSAGAPPGWDIWTDKGVHYKTLVQAYWNSSHGSPSIPIRAVVPGPSGNTPAHTITRTKWDREPYMNVTNLRAVGGGSSRQTHKVLASDFDNAVTTLRNRLFDDLGMTLRLTEPRMTYFPASTPSFNVVADHGVGDEVDKFHLAMNLSIDLYGLSDRHVNRFMTDALKARLAPGHVLTSDAVHIDYAVDDVTPNGDVSLHGKIIGYEFATPDTRGAAQKIAGRTIADATAELARMFPDADFQIQTSYRLPVLPVVADRITLRIGPKPLL